MKTRAVLLSLLCLLAAMATWLTLRPSAEELAERAAKKADAAFLERVRAHPRLAAIFSHPNEVPPLSVLTALRPEDEPELIREYQQKTNFYQRIAAMSALAFAGGDATVPVFKHALTDEFKGRLLARGDSYRSIDEYFAMVQTVLALGLIAKRSDAAWDLLKQGTNSDFWKKSALWQSDEMEDKFRLLAGNCIQGIAMSGRKEVPELLEAIAQAMKQPPMRWPFERTLNGYVLNSAYHYALSRDEKTSAPVVPFNGQFIEAVIGPEFHEDKQRTKWMTTPEGQKWDAWHNAFETENVRLMKEFGKKFNP